ncbi:MAG: hypothetical protein ACYCWW_16115, partial [Deltaproteobacteria bacterium]
QNTTDQKLSYPQEMCYALGLYWPGNGTLFCLTAGGNDQSCQCGVAGTVDTGPGGSTVQVQVSRQDQISGVLGDSPAAGDPIYCTLFRAQDWPATSPQPTANAQPYYQTYLTGVTLTDSSSVAELTFNDVTPGDYSAFCYMDTVCGGLLPGTGDPISYPLGSVTATAGQTATTSVVLDIGLPKN